jgi:hypothetical protein
MSVDVFNNAVTHCGYELLILGFKIIVLYTDGA